ncbi:uncharacterized protein LOC121387728 [Gigantopelta aegis]|uniref:uncharacterized protein LOC121387728 n=1 Tax=Gigantopelta aegis TaxID=1735272 RepID=UPI001B88E276|nr:uncharacterized protein LOC121387728 [Gigantopelta aegis]
MEKLRTVLAKNRPSSDVAVNNEERTTKSQKNKSLKRGFGLKPKKSTRSVPNFLDDSYEDSETEQREAEQREDRRKFQETIHDSLDVVSNALAKPKNNPEGDSEYQVTQAWTSSSSSSSDESGTEETGEGDWCMMDDIISHFEDHEDQNMVTLLVGKEEDTGKITERINKLDEKLKKTEKVLIETQNHYLDYLNDHHGDKEEMDTEKADLFEEPKPKLVSSKPKTPVRDSSTLEGTQDDFRTPKAYYKPGTMTRYADVYSITELSDTQEMVTSYSEEELDTETDYSDEESKSMSVSSKQKTSVGDIPTLVRTPDRYRSHKAYYLSMMKRYPEDYGAPQLFCRQETDTEKAELVELKSKSISSKQKLQSQSTPINPIKQTKDKVKVEEKEISAHDLTKEELDALNMGELWESLQPEAKLAEEQVEQNWDQMKLQLNSVQNDLIKYASDLQNRFRKEMREIQNSSQYNVGKDEICTMQQGDMLGSGMLESLKVKESDDLPKTSKPPVQERPPLEAKESVMKESGGAELEYPLLEAYGRFVRVMSNRKVEKIPTFEQWYSSVISVAGRIKEELSEVCIPTAPSGHDVIKALSNFETEIRTGMTQVPVRKSASDRPGKFTDVSHLLENNEPKAITKQVDDRSVEELNFIRFRETYDRAFRQKKEWLINIIQDRIAKESIANSASTSGSQLSQKPSSETQQLLSTSQRKRSMEALLSQMSIQSDTSLPNTWAALRRNLWNHTLKTESCLILEGR